MNEEKISVILPFCREWPQVAFTIRSIAEALKTQDFEIIAIDNLQSNQKEDRGTKNIKSMAVSNEWLKYIRYDKKLSHWQCKNIGMHSASGDFFWFIDAHCIMPYRSAVDMFFYYMENWKDLNGSIHLPLSYHILESKQLIYKAVVDVPKADFHYVFHTYNHRQTERRHIPDYPYGGEWSFEVPAMSTCGMLVHRSFMERISGWPKELGIYGGGENYINYIFAVNGWKKHIYRSEYSLYHHGDKRGYQWNHNDYQKNRAIATYMFGGERLLYTWLSKNDKISNGLKASFERRIVKECGEHRKQLALMQKQILTDFVLKWKDTEFMKGDYNGL